MLRLCPAVGLSPGVFQKVLSVQGLLSEQTRGQTLSAYFPISLEGFSVGKSVTIEVSQIPLQEENTNKPPDLTHLPCVLFPTEVHLNSKFNPSVSEGTACAL